MLKCRIKTARCHFIGAMRELGWLGNRMVSMSAVGMGIPMGMGMGWVWGRNSVPTAALDSAVGMGIPMGIPMGIGMGWVWGHKFRPHDSTDG